MFCPVGSGTQVERAHGSRWPFSARSLREQESHSWLLFRFLAATGLGHIKGLRLDGLNARQGENVRGKS